MSTHQSHQPLCLSVKVWQRAPQAPCHAHNAKADGRRFAGLRLEAMCGVTFFKFHSPTQSPLLSKPSTVPQSPRYTVPATQKLLGCSPVSAASALVWPVCVPTPVSPVHCQPCTLLQCFLTYYMNVPGAHVTCKRTVATCQCLAALRRAALHCELPSLICGVWCNFTDSSQDGDCDMLS